MNYIPVRSYTNYIDAHIIKSRLEDMGILSWLKDEHTVTIDPILTNALGGIKLMVNERDVKDALEILQLLDKKRKEAFTCPICNSNNIDFVSTPRKAINWISALTTFFLGDYAITLNKVYHCFNCGNEFKDMPNSVD